MKFQADHSQNFQPYKITITVENETDNKTLTELTQSPKDLRVATDVAFDTRTRDFYNKCVNLPPRQQDFLTSLRRFVKVYK